MISWFRKKLFRKLAVSLILIIVGSMFFMSSTLTRILKEDSVEKLTTHLTTQAKIVASQLPLTSQNYWNISKPFQQKVNVFEEACQCRVSIINIDGVVIADSRLEYDELMGVENHKHRPEIRSALSGRMASHIRQSRTIGEDLLYAAVPVLNQAEVVGVLRLALPLTEVQKYISRVQSVIFIVAVVTTVIAIIVALIYSRSISQPVAKMSNVASRIANGEYDARIHYIPEDEHGQLGKALNFLSSRVQSTVEDLQQGKAQLTSVLDNMVEAVFAVNPAGEIIVMNPALATLFDVEKEKVMGKTILESFRHHPLNDLVAFVLKEKQATLQEIRIHQMGEKTLEVHAVPLRQGGDFAGALVVMHDITRIRTLEKIRKDFVANISHELRTPLASIKGYAETLLSGALRDRKNRMTFVETIDRQADRMSRLVNDLLELSVLETAPKPINKEKVDVSKVCKEVVQGMKPLAGKKKLSIKMDKFRTLPRIHADRNKLKQVLVNLVDNAIKASKSKGKIVVRGVKGPKNIKILVSDEGVGIADEDLSRLFERFYRTDKARSRTEGGTGLGLSIVKHIVEAHGGRVSVESRVGKGSVFEVTLPLS